MHLTASASHLITPHGGELINLIAQPERSAELKAHSKEWPSWDLTGRQLCDLELLLTGGFSPLRGFMTRADYEGVCTNMRLANGILWPMPITLDVTEEFAKKLTPGTSKIALRDPEGVMLAVLDVEEIWQPDRRSQGRIQHHQPRTPGRGLRHQQIESVVRRGQARRNSNSFSLRFPQSSPNAC
jgi:sulfate adenylyltransferase